MADWTRKNFDALRDVSPADVPMQWRFARAALGSPELGVIRFTYEPGARMPWGHRHREQEEIYVVARGTLTMRFGDDVRKVTAGSVARVAPRTPRSHRNEGDEAVELWAFSRRIDREDATKLDDFWEASPDAAQTR